MSSNGRSLSTGSNRVDDPLKSEGTETPNVKPPSNEKVVLLYSWWASLNSVSP